MSEIEVPDFKNVYEFDRWVYKLEDKEIQSWKTKDWLKMYEKLNKLPAQRTNPEKESLKDALIKLNRNYRLEEDDFKKMQEIGKKIGHNLAQQKMDFDLASVNVNNDFMEGAREQYARAADKAVYESSQYAKTKDTPLGNYDKVASEISISEADKVDYIGVAREVNEYSSEISLSNTVQKDVFGSTAIHESVHAQLQTLRTGQQEALAKLGLKPEEGFSEDFYKLLQYNDKYYVENTPDSRIYGDLEIKLQEGTITQQEFEKLKKSEILKGSTKQPLETEAQIIGLTAEHYYRQETGQLSERAARTVTDIMGKPQLAQYNEKGKINLSYRVENKEAFDKKLSSLSEDKVGNITAVYDEKRRIYTLTVPSKTTKQELEHVTTKMAQSAEKAATKTALKAQAANAAKKVGKTAIKTAKVVGNTALKANAKFDAAVDKVIDKGAEKINNSKVGKAYNKAAEKVAESKVGKTVSKATTKVVEKAASTTAGKAVGKVVTKTVGTAVGKSVLKKIPVVSLAAGAYFAYERYKQGDTKGACAELASGAAGCFPGAGTAASVAIDAGLVGRDVYNVVQENKAQTAKVKPTKQNQPQKKVAPKDLSKQIAERTETKKKTTQKTTISTNQIAQVRQSSRA